MAITPISPDAIRAAAQRLRAGRLVAFPTETVYGLGADATNAEAVAAIYATKGRPRFNPLIMHVADAELAAAHGRLTPIARALAEAFWPGPLTLVLERTATSDVCDLATAGLPTIALRVPAHPLAHELLQAVGVPIAAPSANRSGHVSPTRAEHVEADLGVADVMILDGGPTSVGLESTVVDASGERPIVLRLGGVARESLEAALRMSVAVATGAGNLPASPGMLERHYAPRTALRLDAEAAEPGEAWLGFGPDASPHSGPTVSLSPGGDLTEAATRLFAALRTLDAAGCTRIAVAPIPEEGLGEAINDRLRRAARGANDSEQQEP